MPWREGPRRLQGFDLRAFFSPLALDAVMVLFPMIAVDVGNQRIKCGWFREANATLPEPEGTITVDHSSEDLDRLAAFADGMGGEPFAWWIGSVHRRAATRLIDWIRRHRPGDQVRLLAAGDLPLRVAVPRPDMVGIDRLLDAVAVNQLRSPGRAAVVVDVGTAITVDYVSEEGVFLGGAILPGIAISARALHEFTDLLPLIAMSELAAAPPALGDSTESAMRAGLFWGAVGAIRQLVGEMAKGRREQAEVFLTGGAGPVVAGLLGPTARHVSHLTLAGIALAARNIAA